MLSHLLNQQENGRLIHKYKLRPHFGVQITHKNLNFTITVLRAYTFLMFIHTRQPSTDNRQKRREKKEKLNVEKLHHNQLFA